MATSIGNRAYTPLAAAAKPVAVDLAPDEERLEDSLC
jgi:hypothetical protein